MSELDNLNTSVANLQAAAQTIIAKLDELKAGSIDPAQVQAAADAVQAATDSLTAASA